MQNVLLAFLPFLGVVAGAVLQFYFTKNREDKNYKRGQKVIAYSDFLKGLSGQMDELDLETRKNSKMLLLDSTMRISLYGSRNVVEAISNLIKSGADFKSLETQKSLIQVCKEMRKEGVGEIVNDSDISLMLFHEEVN